MKRYQVITPLGRTNHPVVFASTEDRRIARSWVRRLKKMGRIAWFRVAPHRVKR